MIPVRIIDSAPPQVLPDEKTGSVYAEDFVTQVSYVRGHANGKPKVGGGDIPSGTSCITCVVSSQHKSKFGCRRRVALTFDMGGTAQEVGGIPSLQQLRDCLLDRSQPIAKRTHSAFFLRTLGTTEAVSAVGEGVSIVAAATYGSCVPTENR